MDKEKNALDGIREMCQKGYIKAREDRALRRVCQLCKRHIGGREDFRDELSWREYQISHMCQHCQDEIF